MTKETYEKEEESYTDGIRTNSMTIAKALTLTFNLEYGNDNSRENDVIL